MAPRPDAEGEASIRWRRTAGTLGKTLFVVALTLVCAAHLVQPDSDTWDAWLEAVKQDPPSRDDGADHAAADQHLKREVLHTKIKTRLQAAQRLKHWGYAAVGLAAILMLILAYRGRRPSAADESTQSPPT